MGESFQIQRQTTSLGAAVKPPGEIVYVGGREAFVALLLREVDDGLRPQATIEMVVKDHLGQGTNERFVNLH
jgi:hypothetical protein